jgi:ABC-type uncharacterized transport system auxiliary subunit
MYNSKQARAIIIVTVLVSLAGCAGKVRYPSYYVLDVPARPSVNDRPQPILGSVAVREFSAPEFLREGPIAYRPSPEQLDFYNYHRWAEDPRRVVTAAVVREMQARGIFQSVVLFDGRGTPEGLVTGTLDHLEEVDQGSNVSIEVGLSARLTNLRTGEVLWQGASSNTAKLDQRSVPGEVAEMSREVGCVVENLISSMQDRLSASRLALSHSNSEQ